MVRKGMRCCFLLLFLFCLIYCLGYVKAAEENSRLYQSLLSDCLPEDIKGTDWTAPERQEKLAERLEQLKGENQDFCGIIVVPGTQIQYPVVQSSREGGLYYLRRNFYGSSNTAGCIFMDHRCEAEALIRNMILYGHRMRNGQMFADLKNYRQKSYWEEHPEFYWITRQGIDVYQICSVYLALPEAQLDEEIRYYQQGFFDGDEKETEGFAMAIKAWSLYDTGVIADGSGCYMTLKTCDYAVADGRIAVVGKWMERKPLNEE